MPGAVDWFIDCFLDNLRRYRAGEPLDRPGGPRAGVLSAFTRRQVSNERKLGDVGTRVLFENERVRIWELDLAPGERSATHRHELDYVIVQIGGDRIAAIPEPDTAGAFRDYIEADVAPGKARFVGARRHRDGHQRRPAALPRDSDRAEVTAVLVLGDILRRHAARARRARRRTSSAPSA